MIRKSLLLLALSIFASSSVLATVTSHKEWNAPGLKLTLSPTKNNTALYNMYLSNAKADKTATQWLQATSKINDVKIFEDKTTIFASANSTYFLGNFTTEYQIYVVTHSVCTMKKEGELYKQDRCSNSSSIYSVEPNRAEFSSGDAGMSWTDIQPGDYLINFGVAVKNIDGETMFNTYDSKLITIPANT